MTDGHNQPKPAARGAARAEAPRGAFARARAYVTRRVDPLTSLFLVVPLFLIYHLGVLTQMDCSGGGCRWAGNGVDFITSSLLSATHGSRLVYALIALGTALALGGGVLWARRRAKLHPRLFVPVLLESALWASLVGPTIVALQRAVSLGAPGATSFLGDIIASCGAGLHEELIFRVVCFAGGAWALKKLGTRPWIAVVIAAVASSLLFSAVHHLGALGEPFTISAFVFRVLAGLFFATVYQTRGFAIAAWTHAMYDVWVFAMQRLAGH
jgi:hypothetical protein